MPSPPQMAGAEPKVAHPQSSSNPISSVADVQLPATSTPDSVLSGVVRPLSGTQKMPLSAMTENNPNAVLGDLEDIQAMVREFRTALGENPVGSNSEIMRTLQGDNIRQVQLTLPGAHRLDEKGELVDRWGTAYFFHQVSATEMEVRSAGPDRVMWTPDDRQAK